MPPESVTIRTPPGTPVIPTFRTTFAMVAALLATMIAIRLAIAPGIVDGFGHVGVAVTLAGLLLIGRAMDR